MFYCASSSWNKVKFHLDATLLFNSCILNSACFVYINLSSGTLEVELQHMVFCTEFLDGWWSWEPLRRSCVRCGWCRAAPSTHFFLSERSNFTLVCHLYSYRSYCCASSSLKIDHFWNIALEFFISDSS